ncbi:MAG TPA: sensor histidine kinase [Pseudobacteroides sp.]|uniref:sensor histidine kinase n=1 Tax=Pseudobacteroides sp. TaxID=1968840 RepID=UPI002F941162
MGFKRFRKLYYSISIKSKLNLLIFILMAYSIVFIAYFGYKSYASVFEEKSTENLVKNVDVLSTILSDRLENVIKSSAKILLDDKLYAANDQLKSGLNEPYLSNPQTFKSDIEIYLGSYVASSNEFDLMAFRFNISNKTYFADNNLTLDSEKIISDDKLFQMAKKSSGNPVWYFKQQKGKPTEIYIIREVLDYASANESIGTLVCKVNENYLFGTIRDFLTYNVQNVSIYNDNGLLVYQYNTFDEKYKTAWEELLKSSEPSGFYSAKHGGDTIYLAYNEIPKLKWKLAVFISSNLLLVDMKKVLITIFILCLITLPIWLILIYTIYRDIINPVYLLVDRMDKIEKGNTGITVADDRLDELGYVFKTFNRMSEEINRLINKVYKESLMMKDAEIKALQAQINPHFLCNTLETINWKAKLYGVDDISEMVTALSSIIDANLDRNNEKMIPIRRELDYIDNYNLLIQKRFGKKIRFIKSIDDDALDYKIPKLLIQPLIENSIYHGLETKKGGGTVELIISIEEDMLLIIVADDGKGIDDETLKKLKQSLEENVENQYESRTKIGIMNVHRRIKLIYGSDFGLKIFSEAGKGTTIILKLPFNEDQGVGI